jgi:ADP-ribosylglycohydrolase
MALCLANSLVACRNFLAYDQLVRYKWWYEDGYMSSTGHCFDIGAATRDSLQEFSRRQNVFAKKYNIPVETLDSLSDNRLRQKFKVYCSQPDVAGNGALMRLAPVPLFFNKLPIEAVEFSGYSGQITHGDIKAYDACRYYGALIVAALHGCKKDDLLDSSFYEKHKSWFNGKPLCNEIKMIAEGSYKKYGGYNDGIRGKGYIVNALEAALWAFWSDDDSFEKGALAAVNLGDDTDTTAAIYGQQVYAKNFILNLSKWLAYEGGKWEPQEAVLSSNQSSKYTAKSASVDDLTSNETASNHLQHQSKSVSITVLNEEKSSWRKFLPFFDNKKRAKRSAALATLTPKPQRRQHEPRLSADNLNFAVDGRSKL